MQNVKTVVGISCLISIFFVCAAYGQQKEQPANPQPVQPVISVTGRLAMEALGKQDELILHSKDGETYYLIGNLHDSLQKSLKELGGNNVVTVSGKKTGKRFTVCTRKFDYEPIEGGQDQLKINATCIHYWALEVNEVLLAKQSNETIASPNRDAEEEKKAVASALSDRRRLELPPIAEIRGTITAVNFQAPIKTIEIVNLDKENPLKTITLMLRSDTRVVKQAKANQEPMPFDMKVLKPGQEVTAQYFRGKVEKEAIVITITKE